MPPLVLVIEDEESVGKAIAEVCASLGLETTIAKRGADALAAFDVRTPDLITLDLLLPGGMDGRKVAEAIRAKPVGSDIPIVVLSGFIKDAKVQSDLQTKYGIKGFLAKPLKPDDLRAVLAAPLGLEPRAGASAPVPMAGPPAAHERTGMDSFEVDLRERSPYTLFGELHRAKAEGVLELARGNAKKRFWIQRGFFRFATSNVKAETLAGLVLAKGVLEATVTQALQTAKTRGISLGDALVEARAVGVKDLPALLSQQTEEVAATSFQWTDGTGSFRAGASDTNIEGRANPVICVMKGVKRFVTPPDALARLKSESKSILDRTPELDREMFALKNLFPTETLMPMINGRATVGELTTKAKEGDLVLLCGLVTSGLVRARRPVSAPTAESLATPARPVTRPSRAYTDEEEASRALIGNESRRQTGAVTHYQVLGVAPTADQAAIKAAYLKLARTFHTDAFAGQELGDLAPAQEQVFKRISEANGALGEAKQREEYDTYLDRKAKGLPTDINDILRADSAYSRGEAARIAGRLRDADKLFREAVQLNSGEHSFMVALARTTLSIRGKEAGKECLDLLDKALQIEPNSLVALKIKGQIQLELGQANEAVETLRKVTSVNPNFEDASNLLRQAKAARSGPAEPEKGGLLGKLFSGKGK